MSTGLQPLTPESSSPEPYASPPTPPPETQPAAETAIPNAEAAADPPPPYPTRERRSRTERARLRRAAQLQSDGALVVNTTMQPLRIPADQLMIPQSELSPLTPEEGTESTPLLVARRRPRTMSHSTGVSAHSITQTVLSLLGADEEDADADAVGNVTNMDIEANTSPVSPRSTRRIQRYFRPLWRMAYYRPLIHLLVINFFYALVAFVYLFAGTLTGTTLLIALPLGVVFCWLNLAGARVFAKGEIALQTYFHGPLFINTTIPPYPIFSRSQTPVPDQEGATDPQTRRPAFLRNTYIMFTDQTTYQAIFYFLVIKPSITLFLSIVLVIVVPVVFLLVFPAPALLRAIKRIGVWQASIALEGLLLPRL